MPRFVQVVRMCENHPDEPATDEELPPFRMGSGTSMQFDVCKVCMKDIVIPFLDLMAKGTEMERKAPDNPKRPEHCPLPDCTYSAPNRRALGSHLRSAHSTGFRTLREEGYDI